MTRERPLLLDLFCGAGGCSEGYRRAGFDVVGVDINPQKNYPFEFHQGDALGVLQLLLEDEGWYGWRGFVLSDFAAIHASPPCQRYSIASKRWNGAAETHPDLVAPVRELLKASGLPYVIENVPGAPLEDPAILCGSMFDLGVRRHRLFEASFPIHTPTCRHETQPKRYRIYDHGKWYLSSVAHVHGHGGGKSKGDWPEAMGIDWMTNREIAQAIPPAYTEYIGQQLMAHLLSSQTAIISSGKEQNGDAN